MARKSGNQDQLAAQMTVRLMRYASAAQLERKGLHLDHNLVLSQQVGDLVQGLRGTAVRAATCDGRPPHQQRSWRWLRPWPELGARLISSSTGVLPTTSNTSVNRSAGSVSHPVGYAIAVSALESRRSHKVVLVASLAEAITRAPRASRHLDGDRSHAASASVDE